MSEKLPVSVLVASCNEGHLLEDCLKSLQFCDEIYFVNLGSTDNSIELAKKYATVVEEFHKVPRIEDVHPIYIPKLKYDWFILIDPDERIRPELAEDIRLYIQNPEPFKSLIRAYLWYYFKGEKLKGGPYKNAIRGRLLFYRPGINISDEVHTGITAKPGYGLAEIPFTGKNYDEHFWCNSWAQLKDKHTRYAQGEGKVLYLEGKRFTWVKLIFQTLKAFLYAFIKQEYYRDGFTGVSFSYHEGRYSYISWMSLRKYQAELKIAGKLQTTKQVAIEQMQQKVQQFVAETEQIILSYKQTEDTNLKTQIIQQYQKSLHRLVNDALEINAFDLAKKAMDSASFNEEMKTYIVNGLLMERVKLIQNSGSYRLLCRLKSKIIFI
jgi:glycosyltransferase involved in cell wall biosynthesis